MKTLFIWSLTTKNYIKSISAEIKETTYVFGEDELSEIDINVFQSIFILVELSWDANFYKGYAVAERIIENWMDDKNPPNIQFFSPSNQLKLYSETKGIEKFFVKSFKHHQIPITSQFKSKKYSSSKWRYLKQYGLQKSGFLNRLQHTISSLINMDQSELKIEVPKIRNQLHQMSNIVGEEIVTLYHQDYDVNLRDYLQQLVVLLKKRILEIEGARIGVNLIPDNSKPLLLLLEDDLKYADRIEGLLKDYFRVSHFDNGNQALQEITKYGYNYAAAIFDLELLKNGTPLDQDLQGIEVLECVRANNQHISWRIITGLPRKGVKELIDVEINNILHKNQLELYGYNEVLEQFVQRILKQVSDNKFLLRLPGPSTSFWNVVSKRGNEGGKFKSFYYDLKNSNDELFYEMWRNIKEKWNLIIVEKNDETRISTNLIKPANIGKWLANPKTNLREKANLLERILLHRLIFISKFTTGETIYYRKNSKGYANDPIWEEPLSSSPKAYTPILGFETKNLKPKHPTKDHSIVTFIFEDYGGLFHEEIEIIKSVPELRKSTFTSFYDQHEKACKTIASIQFLILEDQKNYNSQFKNDYGKLVIDAFNLNEELCKKIVQSLAGEKEFRSRSNAWFEVDRYIAMFKYEDDYETVKMEYKNFPFKEGLDRFINEY